VFIPGKLFQPSLMFASKAGANLSEAGGRPLPLHTNITLGWKSLPGTNTLAHYENT